MKTILIILSLILVMFFLSEDRKLNKIMKKQSIPFIIILLLFYLFFNKIDIRIVVFALVITIISCSNIFSKTNLIIENLKLIGNPDLKTDQYEHDLDLDHVVQEEVQDDLKSEDSGDIKEAFNYEELHGMFKELDEDINNK